MLYWLHMLVNTNSNDVNNSDFTPEYDVTLCESGTSQGSFFWLDAEFQTSHLQNKYSKGLFVLIHIYEINQSNLDK